MTCKICGGKTTSLGSIPFDSNNANMPIVDETPVEYTKCTKCYNIVCPEMLSWPPDQLRLKVYNQDYIKYDPDYTTGVRAGDYGKYIKGLLPNYRGRHLDYGSGGGLLSKYLGWNSTNYDPYANNIKPTGLFKFITVIEVIEHSTDLEVTIKDIVQYLDKRGVIFMSTCLADKDTPISWAYIAPRNGHINIQSVQSMKIIATKYSLFFNSISENIHVLQATRNDFKDLQRESGR